MSNFQKTIEEKVMPVMGKISANKVIKSITAGMMATMPLTLGVSIITIVSNFPVASWTNWLVEKGIKAHMDAAVTGTTEIIALFLAFIVAYNYAKLREADGITAGVFSLGAFMILMPHQMTLQDGTVLSVFQKAYLGSSGVFVSMLIAILVTALYCYLNKKGLVIKLPDSVPEMVSKSLSPTFIAMIIFVVIVVVRIGFGATQYGNIFDFINATVAKPVMYLGTSPISIIVIYSLCNLLWCFGIHPSSLTSVLVPVFMTAITSNVTAFQSGEKLPYLAFMIVYMFVMLGGTGATLGLALDMAFLSKSERFKTLGKLVLIPNLFNINEPLIFGTPIIFNPIFMLPMTLSGVVTGSLALFFVKLGIYNSYNPTVKMPWTMPAPIIHLVQTGAMAALAVIATIAITALLYYPFFRYADRQALKEESTAKSEQIA